MHVSPPNLRRPLHQPPRAGKDFPTDRLAVAGVLRYGGGGELAMARTAMASGLLLLALAGSSFARAGLPAYDFTGPWVGVILAVGMREDLTAELASTAARIEGSVTAEGALGTVQCSARGKRRRMVVLRLTCADGTHVKLKGALDVATDTLAGRARLSKRGHGVKGTFTLTKQSP
jgi:hypothetical protein